MKTITQCPRLRLSFRSVMAFATFAIVVALAATIATSEERQRALEGRWRMFTSTFRTADLLVDNTAAVGSAINVGSANPSGVALTVSGKIVQTASQLITSPHASFLISITGLNYKDADGGIQVFNSTSYDTGSGTAQSFAGFYSDQAVVGSGANTLTNHGLYSTAASGTTNYSGLFDLGFFRVNDTSLLTNVDASNIVSEGYLQVNGTTDLEGHLFVTPALPPAISACGDGTAQVVGSDIAGYVHIGAGSTTCTLTFNTPYVSRPACIIQNEGGNDNIGSYTVSATAFTYDATGLTSGQNFDYMCTGIRAAPHALSDQELLARLLPPPEIRIDAKGYPYPVPPTPAQLASVSLEMKRYRISAAHRASSLHADGE